MITERDSDGLNMLMHAASCRTSTSSASGTQAKKGAHSGVKYLVVINSNTLIAKRVDPSRAKHVSLCCVPITWRGTLKREPTT